jgi:hypothetical protein
MRMFADHLTGDLCAASDDGAHLLVDKHCHILGVLLEIRAVTVADITHLLTHTVLGDEIVSDSICFL